MRRTGQSVGTGGGLISMLSPDRSDLGSYYCCLSQSTNDQIKTNLPPPPDPPPPTPSPEIDMSSNHGGWLFTYRDVAIWARLQDIRVCHRKGILEARV